MTPKSTHILDLTGVAELLPAWWPKGYHLLPLVRGTHSYDWDLVKSEIGVEAYDQFVKMAKAKMPDGDETIPIGFDEARLPQGAVIKAKGAS